jgi:hypothetical protein
MPASLALPPASARARAVFVCVVAQSILEGGLALHCALNAWLSAHAPLDVPDALYDAYDRFWDVEDVVRRLSVFASGFAFLFWWHRIARQAWVQSDPKPRWTPDWAVAAWFIPFANLFVPYDYARQIERAFGRSPSPLLLHWWIVNVVRNLGWAVVQRVVTDVELGTRAILYGGATAGTAVAAWLCIGMVRYLERSADAATTRTAALEEVFS